MMVINKYQTSTTTNTMKAAASTVATKRDDDNDNNDTNGLIRNIIPNGGSKPLGTPLPMDEHACSVSLPTWQSIVGYEEGDINIIKQLKCGYPRFVYHPYILQLMSCILNKYSNITSTSPASSLKNHSKCNNNHHYTEDCLLLPSKLSALRCQTFLQLALQEYKYQQLQDIALIIDNDTNNNITDNLHHQHSRVRVIEWNTKKEKVKNSMNSNEHDDDINDNHNDDIIYAVLFPATTIAGTQAKAYWQHTGELVSSRRAERALRNINHEISRITGNDEHYIIHHSSFFDDNKVKQIANESMTPNHNEIKSNPGKDESSNHYSKNHISPKSILPTSSLISSSPHEQLCSIITEWVGLDSQYTDHVFLTPSGMASIYMALRSSRRYQLLNDDGHHNTSNNKGGTSIVYGFPYLDTLKLCSRPELSPDGVEFFGTGCMNDLNHLEQLLKRNNQGGGNKKSYCALFTEVPSNPLLQCPDLYQLRQLADQYNFAIIVDDTISNFLNVDVITNGIADVVCTSLTKLVSGRGDAIAGSFVCNPYTDKGRWIQQDLLLQRQQNNSNYNGLHAADANAIVLNSYDFIERNEIINNNAVQLAEWLQSDDCADVDQVYYPKLNVSSVQHYHQVMRPQYNNNDINNRYGGLLSVTLHPHMCQRHFYDALDVAKGPSLGTNFTLVCPYTLLAHYHELDFAMGYNVPPNLLRIAVGLEPFHIIQDKFYKAFNTSRLYPKPIHTTKTKSNTSTKFNNSIEMNQQQQQSPPSQHQQQTKRNLFTSTTSCYTSHTHKAITTPTTRIIRRLITCCLLKR